MPIIDLLKQGSGRDGHVNDVRKPNRACNEPAVWSELAHAQLGAGQVVDAIESFIKEYQAMIQVAEQQGEYAALVKFLTLARKQQARDPLVETELCYTYVKTGMLAELEELTSSPNSARERCGFMSVLTER
jgi:clathrin heavy chain